MTHTHTHVHNSMLQICRRQRTSRILMMPTEPVHTHTQTYTNTQTYTHVHNSMLHIYRRQRTSHITTTPTEPSSTLSAL